jgi:hypothetical protein
MEFRRGAHPELGRRCIQNGQLCSNPSMNRTAAPIVQRTANLLPSIDAAPECDGPSQARRTAQPAPPSRSVRRKHSRTIGSFRELQRAYAARHSMRCSPAGRGTAGAAHPGFCRPVRARSSRADRSALVGLADQRLRFLRAVGPTGPRDLLLHQTLLHVGRHGHVHHFRIG